MITRPQKPTLRDFQFMQAETRSQLCRDSEIFDPCEALSQLSSFEKATLKSWSTDTGVDKGLNLYILVHYLSAINANSYYYHYVNNGNPDGSGKSSSLTPHMDALGRTLAQMDVNQEYIQRPNSNNELLFEQPFIISNSTALQVYRSLIYGNRLLCSTECDTLLSNFGVYGNQYNDPRFAENVNMLIQMFDGTKHQNRATLSTSYNIPEGRRASIIGASVGDPYARVSQQHYEGNGVSGAHNRFTHYPCPIMKAIKTNSGTFGVVSNMVPSLQHVYTVSVLLGKVEYVARRNVYDQYEKKQLNIFDSDVEDKWKRLRPMANRQYYQSSSQVDIELEESEDDATYERSKSAFYYMFNRVYRQWQEATETEKEEYEAIINFKNSTKIPRFICNFARFRSILSILWHDDVYRFIEISEVIKAPYRVSESFIEAVKNVVDQMFPSSLRKDDGTKILVIEKDTAIMGDLFFAHVDSVSRQLFDLSLIHEKFNSSPKTSRSLKRNHSKQTVDNENLMCADALAIIQSKFIFFSPSAFAYYRQFHNNKDRWTKAIEYLINNKLIYQKSNKNRFIKGTRNSYAMATTNQIKSNTLSMDTLAKWNLSIDDYEKLWQQCLLPTSEIAAKIDKFAIEHINMNLHDYITIVHRLGDASDPVAQQILKPGLRNGQIGIDFSSNIFSMLPEHIVHFNDDNDIMKQLHKLCIRETDKKTDSLKHGKSLMLNNHHSSNTTETFTMNSSQADMSKISSSITDDVEQLQTKLFPSLISTDISSEIDSTNILKEQSLSDGEKSNLDNNSINGRVLELEPITDKKSHIKVGIVQDHMTAIQQWVDTDNDDDMSSINISNWTQTVSNNIISGEELISDKNNDNKIIDSFISVEYDYPKNDSMNISHIDGSLRDQQQSNEELFSKLSSSITIEYNNVKGQQNTEYDSMEIDADPNFRTSSFDETVSSEYSGTPENLSETSNAENIQPVKTFNVIALSKRLLLKPFIAFTTTDTTRLYNNAETKNVVIGYLQKHGFIRQIDDLFLSNVPMKKMMKAEIGYLKLFPVSKSASETASFETKLREKVGMTFDKYIDKVFIGEKSSMSCSVTNNMFNTKYHNWLLNRIWYEKLKEGDISMYFQNKVICPDDKISRPMVTTPTVSNDDVYDSFDRSRSKLTASQRTNKELRRLGVKRRKQPGDEPPQKRQRKPKRFPDGD